MAKVTITRLVQSRLPQRGGGAFIVQKGPKIGRRYVGNGMKKMTYKSLRGVVAPTTVPKPVTKPAGEKSIPKELMKSRVQSIVTRVLKGGLVSAYGMR